MSTQRPPVVDHRPEIQGLRAVAVILVIGFHLNKAWLPAGFIGVDMFFVISGFLMTLIILGGLERGGFSLWSFYLARIRRIVPAYMVLLVVVTAVMAVVTIPDNYRDYTKSLLYSTWFGANKYFAQEADYFAADSTESPLLHLWSLAIEMQFYLILPLVLIVIRKRFLALLILISTLVLFAYATVQLGGEANSEIYFSLLARIPEFFVGALAALFARSRTLPPLLGSLLGWAGVVAIVLTVVFLSDSDPFPGVYAIPVTVGTALLLLGRPSAVHRALVWKPMQKIGDLSYSLYLWHWPVFAVMRYILETYELPVWAVFFSLGLTFALSYLSWKFVEQPFRTKGAPVKDLVKLSIFPLLALAVIPVGEKVNTDAIQALPTEQSRYENRDNICHGQILESCTRGDPDGTLDILLVGDSHAAQLNYFADVVGENLDITFTVISASACPAIPGNHIDRYSGKTQENCLAQAAEVNAQLDTFDAVVMAGRWTNQGRRDQFLTDMGSFLESTQENGQPTLVLGQLRELTGDPQRQHRFRQIGIAAPMGLREGNWVLGNAEIRKVSENYPHVLFLDPTPLPVFDTVPFYQGKLLYFDEHHLNEFGAKQYGEAATSDIEQWLIGSGLK